MRTRTDIEAYLQQFDVPYDEVGDDDMWITQIGDAQTVIVSLTGPLVVMRTKVLDLSEVTDAAALNETLLKLNADGLVHASYGISDDAIVLTCAMQVENLDYNEFVAALDDIAVALANHRQTLQKFRRK